MNVKWLVLAVLEVFGDACLLAFGAILELIFVSVMLTGTHVGIEPNETILLSELSLAALIVVMGIVNLIIDFGWLTPYRFDPIEKFADVVTIAFGIFSVGLFVDIYTSGKFVVYDDCRALVIIAIVMGAVFIVLGIERSVRDIESAWRMR